MEWKSLDELREAFLNFYEEKAHKRLKSYSLVPQGDKSLLLINSGMAPMKKFFVGELTPPAKRITTCQKCIRNNDIENVGRTSRHLTYFEMLGNFSFGDYFKEQAIKWAWAFFTECLHMPAEKLYISVYEEDDEAYEIWTKIMGIPESRMVRLGKEDNFWEHGVGPCGPCSEIYVDRGEAASCGKADCAPGCDCDRFVEVGNIVFSQFDSDGQGNYTPMEKPNIDFGMGLERLACMVQGVKSVFEIDTMQRIRQAIEKQAGVQHGESKEKDVSLHVITDHIRSVTFMIGDGILGSNEGRGYVLRRLIRRAARHGRLLGIRDVFLSDIADVVIEENQKAYPELMEKRDMIKKVIDSEEESFSKTIDQGLEILNGFITGLKEHVLSGDDAFLLNDTYGFPLDLTKEILAEKNIDIDEARFLALMNEQRVRARNARKNAGAEAWTNTDIDTDMLPETDFTGYDQTEQETELIAIIENGAFVDTASAGDAAVLILKKTPFYAESGGQSADIGLIETETGSAQVIGVTKNQAGVFFHEARIKTGSFLVGTTVQARINTGYRKDIMRNHTAAHLLQAALRRVLGSHVEQAGQMVNASHVRFDFTHFQAMEQDELARTEALVNQIILDAMDVTVKEMPVEEARKIGAMALFGEKYGDVVRVVSIGDFSMELCGGTHVDNTSKLGLFRVISEASVASGVRRIEGVTGKEFLRLMDQHERILAGTAKAVKAMVFSDLPAKAADLMTELSRRNKLLEQLQAKIAASGVSNILEEATEAGGVRIVSKYLGEMEIETMKSLCDRIREQEMPVAAILAGGKDGRFSLVAGVSKAAQAMGVKAGQLVKQVAEITGGKGGGRPDFAMAGVKDASKLTVALDAVPEIIQGTLAQERKGE